MKIVDIAEFWPTQEVGLHRFLLERARCLAGLPVEHTIVAPGPRNAQTFAGASRLITLAGPSMPSQPGCHALVDPGEVAQVVERLRPDVVEAHSPFAAAFAALHVQPRPAVRTLFWHGDPIGTDLLPWVRRFVSPALAKRSVAPLWAGVRSLAEAFDTVVVGSLTVERTLATKGIVGTTRLALGVDRDSFRPSAKSRGVREVLLQVPRPATHLVVVAGRLVREACWELVVHAMSRVQRRIPARLIVAGDGPDRSRLEELARESGVDAVFIGHEPERSRLATLFASSHLLVHASPRGVCSQSIPEALCCGLPVVVPNRGGGAEWSGSRGVWTYEAGDASDCERRIREALRESRANSGRAALETARHVPSSVQAQVEALKLYARLAERTDTLRALA